LDGRITEFNEVYVEMLGYEPEELKTLTYKDITPEKWHAFEAGIQKEQILKRGYSDIFEKEYRRKDGTVFPIELRAFLLRDEAGEPSGMWAIVRDITERKQAEVALRKSEERYRRIVDTAIEGIWALDADMLTDFVNARLAEMIGYQREEIIGRRFESFLFEEDLADHAQRIKLRKQGVSESYERRLRHRQGYAVMVLISASPILDNAGRFQGSFAMLTDITERKQAEDALRESEQRFRVLAQSMAQLVWITDGEGKSIYQNPQFVDYTGLYECTSRELLACVHPEDRVQVQEEFSDAISSGQGGFQKEFRLRRRDGIYRWFLTRVIIMRDADKRVDRLFGTATDIDDLIRTKQALQDNLELLAQAERIGHIGSWKMDVSTNMLTVSAEMRSMLAYPEQAEITVEALLALVHPDDLAGVMAKWQKTLEIGIPSTLEFRGIHPNGTIHYVEVRAEASFDAQGKPVVIQGYAVDLTEKKRLEDELIKAQKLDSIGTLAGGLAHDYNNLLTAILGNIDLAKMHISQSHKAYHLLMEAQKATMRARDLTLQLITFSKGGYPLGKIMSIHGLLAQSVGLALSGTDTKPQWRMADDLPEVKIDENQIRQVIHNIVINAHEAMPQGGILTIEADKDVLGPDNPLVLAEGVYVRLAFYDQGCGISPENLPKVFDPYFSTKDRGSARGLGLGLSICYSIIKRHGGHIMVNSLVGKGTTVTLYIPAAVVQPGA
jgi:PAS domain S-box-containing protein